MVSQSLAHHDVDLINHVPNDIESLVVADLELPHLVLALKNLHESLHDGDGLASAHHVDIRVALFQQVEGGPHVPSQLPLHTDLHLIGEHAFSVSCLELLSGRLEVFSGSLELLSGCLILLSESLEVTGSLELALVLLIRPSVVSPGLGWSLVVLGSSFKVPGPWLESLLVHLRKSIKNSPPPPHTNQDQI